MQPKRSAMSRRFFVFQMRLKIFVGFYRNDRTKCNCPMRMFESRCIKDKVRTPIKLFEKANQHTLKM